MSFKNFSTSHNAPAKAGSAEKAKEAPPADKSAAKAADSTTPAKS